MVKDKSYREYHSFNNLVNVEEYNESWEVAAIDSRPVLLNKIVLEKIGVKIVLFYGLLF
jgi:hypothetical protein